MLLLITAAKGGKKNDTTKLKPKNCMNEAQTRLNKVDRLQANLANTSQECDALKRAILRQVFE